MGGIPRAADRGTKTTLESSKILKLVNSGFHTRNISTEKLPAVWTYALSKKFASPVLDRKGSNIIDFKGHTIISLPRVAHMTWASHDVKYETVGHALQFTGCLISSKFNLVY
jgi:hypothetical protein